MSGIIAKTNWKFRVAAITALVLAGAACSNRMTDGIDEFIDDQVDDGNLVAANDDTSEQGLSTSRGNDTGDKDRDGVLDALDNCPRLPNKDQLDTDNDGRGNECDEDDDRIFLVLSFLHNTPYVSEYLLQK